MNSTTTASHTIKIFRFREWNEYSWKWVWIGAIVCGENIVLGTGQFDSKAEARAAAEAMLTDFNN